MKAKENVGLNELVGDTGVSQENSSISYDSFFCRKQDCSQAPTIHDPSIWQSWVAMNAAKRQEYYDPCTHNTNKGGNTRNEEGALRETQDNKEKLSAEDRYLNAESEILEYMREQMDGVLLKCLGLERITLKNQSILAVIVNGREFRGFDVEHGFWKTNLFADSGRGSRSLSVPKPFAVHCWPT